MGWISQPTPFGFPVFVVWRTLITRGVVHQKSRAVVDIRGLSKIAERDAYPLPLQGDIILAMRGCHYITVVDSANPFTNGLLLIKTGINLPF